MKLTQIKTIALAVALACCLTSNTVAQDRGDLKAVKGVVVDENGNAVAGAEVSLGFPSPTNSTNDQVVKTTPEGKFSLVCKLGGIGQLVVARTPDGSQQGLHTLPYEAKDWKEEEARIVLKPAGKITAKVTSADGKDVVGAMACLMLSYEKNRPLKLTTKTNTEGIAAWMVPLGAEGWSMFSLKSEEGFAVANFRSAEAASGGAVSPQPEIVPLKFDGARTITLKVIDEDGKPVSGARVGGSHLSKPGLMAGQATSANLSFFWNELSTLTKEDGSTSFDWMPKDNGHVSFSASLKGYASARLDIDLQSASPETTLKLTKLVTVSGAVLLADGKPAVGAKVQLVGDGYEEASGRHDTTATDQEGKFEFQVAPDLLCMVAARLGTQVAMPIDWIVTARNKPVTGLVLQLEPGRRIFGRVTVGKDKKPHPGQMIAVRVEGRPAYEIPGVSLPNPKKSNKGVMLMFSQFVTTDEKGEFEFFSSAYKHSVLLQSGSTLYEKFDLANEKEKEIHFHRERPPTIPMRGQVKLKETGEAVTGALISFAYEDQKANNSWTETKSTANGGFQVERAPYSAKIFAITPDGKFADAKSITEDDEKVELELRPTATLRGRTIDRDTGEPLVDKYVTYGIRISMPQDDGSTIYSLRFGNRILTDKDGYFQTGPVATGVEVEVNIQPDNSGRVPTLAKVTPTKGGLVELGELKVAPPRGQ